MSDDEFCDVAEKPKNRERTKSDSTVQRPEMSADPAYQLFIDAERNDDPIIDTGTKREPLPEKKSLHLVLRRAALERLRYLEARIRPGTKTGIIVKALQLFDFMFREHEKGTVFLVKRPGQEIEVLHVFK